MYSNHEVGFDERADVIRVEFDARSPKLRLSIFAYLVENGFTPKDISTTDEFLEILAHVTEYVASDVEEYADYVADFEPEETDAGLDLIILDKDGDDPYGQGGGGYQ